MKSITRRELYEKIWTITKARTAQELNISPTELSRICVENDIPSPTSLYWFHVSQGKPVEKTPLPDPDKNTVISYSPRADRQPGRRNASPQTKYAEILDSELASPADTAALKKLQREVRAGKFAIDFSKPKEEWTKNIDKVICALPVPDVLRSRRPITLQSKAYLALQKLSYSQQLRHSDYNKLTTHLKISVSQSQNERALRIFDTLISIFEALGGKLICDENTTNVRFTDVDVMICITECYKRVEGVREDRWLGNKYQYVPTGKLRINLSIGRYKDAKIEDTEYERLEFKLDAVVRKCLNLVEYELDWRESIRRQEIERRRREEERRIEEERRRELERMKDREREEVRSTFAILRRALVRTLIDNILNDSQANSLAENDILRLQKARGMFAPFGENAGRGNLTEADVDKLAEEFFGL